LTKELYVIFKTGEEDKEIEAICNSFCCQQAAAEAILKQMKILTNKKKKSAGN